MSSYGRSMTTPDLQGILARLHEQVERAAVEPAAVPEVKVTAEGTAAEEKVTVVMSGGRVDEVRLHPAAMRMSNADLAEAFKEATNTAIQAHIEAMTAALQDQQTDFGSLQASLGEIQEQANQAMTAYAHGLDDVLRKVAERG